MNGSLDSLKIKNHVPPPYAYISKVLDILDKEKNINAVKTTLANLTKKEVAACNNAPDKKRAYEKLQCYYLALQQCNSIDECKLMRSSILLADAAPKERR